MPKVDKPIQIKLRRAFRILSDIFPLSVDFDNMVAFEKNAEWQQLSLLFLFFDNWLKR